MAMGFNCRDGKYEVHAYCMVKHRFPHHNRLYQSGTEIKHIFSLTESHHIDGTPNRTYWKYKRIMDHIGSDYGIVPETT
eukprot:13972525-Heterocapsa_arctica.AAC.1